MLFDIGEEILNQLLDGGVGWVLEMHLKKLLSTVLFDISAIVIEKDDSVKLH